MNWYLSKIVYRIFCGDGKHSPQFDEQLRLVAAEDEVQALAKAISLGHAESDTFYNDRRQLVQWQFIAVPEIIPIETWIDGAEVNSSIRETENASGYITFVTEKAAMLRNRFTATEPLNHH